MFYAQTQVNGYTHTIMQTDDIINDIAVIEVPEYNAWYLGAFFDGAKFMKLEIEPTSGQVALNTPLNVVIRWVGIQGQIASRDCIVSVKCGNITENVMITSGVGNTQFESAEPGDFVLEVISSEGCRAVGRVAVQ